MKRMKSIFLKINLTSIFFIAVSFISGTLAWFAYSGLTDLNTEIDIMAWNIEINKDGKAASNKMVVTMPQISPGMETVNETINIKNSGDADAIVKFNVKYARILGDAKDKYVLSDTMNSKFIEDKIAHEYPFHINISVSKDYVKNKGGTSTLDVSVSWPLDSGQDDLDSIWGTNTYDFLKKEEEKFKLDPSYSKELPIEIEIELIAEQDIGKTDTFDKDYAVGEKVMYNPVDNKVCTPDATGCKEGNVIDTYSTLGDREVNIIPSINDTTVESTFDNYPLDVSPLTVEQILKVISKDVINTQIQIPNLDFQALGVLNTDERIASQLLKIKQGSVLFSTQKFKFLTSSSCIWLKSEYSLTEGFAIKSGTIYPEDKTTACKVLPVIKIKK